MIRSRSLRALIAAIPMALLLAGCGTGTSTSTTTPASVVTVTGASTVRLSATTQFAAAVTNATNTAVTWQVNGVAGGSSTTGTISAAGLYSAPAALPASPYTVIVSAVSQANTASIGSATESLQNPLPVPASGTATEQGVSLTYDLDILGTGYVPTSVLSVNGTARSTTYVAANELKATVTVPSGTTTVSVLATNPDPGGSASTAINVTIPQPVTITISGLSTTRLNATAQMSAAVANTANQAVTWQVNGVTGGNATSGTISASGLYTAPATLPASPSTVTITAISQAIPAAIANYTETLQNPIPVATAGTATEVTTTLIYNLDITGTGFVPTSVLVVNGVSQTTTYISATELQTAVTVAVGAASLPAFVSNPNPGTAASSPITITLPTTISATASARILDQTTFGATAALIQNVQQIGINNYLAQQFATPATIEAQIPNPPPAGCPNDSPVCAESQFWDAAINGPDQLRQRVAFALSEMFVVATPSVQGFAIPSYANMLANDAFGNFYTLMNDVTLSPAMGAYLNMLNSAKPATGQIANENYPRELMQLFTLGTDMLNQDGTVQLDASGNTIQPYTETQVQAFARAYTGWTYAVAGGGTPTVYPNATADFVDPMAAVAAYHDTTSKTLLNGAVLPAGQTAQQDLAGALTNIFNHTNVPPFVCEQLIQHLVTSNPSPAYVSRVAQVFIDDGTGTRGNLKAVLTAILTDPEARAGDTNSNYDGGHLREPILFTADVYRALGFSVNTATNTHIPYSYISLSTCCTTPLSETPYAANSVFNFFPPDYVIPGSTLNAPEFGIENTATVILQESVASQMVSNSVTGFAVDITATGTLGTLAATSPTALVNYLSMLFMHSNMPTAMQTAIINEITPLNNVQRIRVATYLVLTSPQYKIIY